VTLAAGLLGVAACLVAAAAGGRVAAAQAAPAPPAADTAAFTAWRLPDGTLGFRARMGCDAGCVPAPYAWVVDGRVLRPGAAGTAAALDSLRPAVIRHVEVLTGPAAGARFGPAAAAPGGVIVVETTRGGAPPAAARPDSGAGAT
jgi:hypothetical protein